MKPRSLQLLVLVALPLLGSCNDKPCHTDSKEVYVPMSRVALPDLAGCFDDGGVIQKEVWECSTNVDCTTYCGDNGYEYCDVTLFPSSSPPAGAWDVHCEAAYGCNSHSGGGM
jgi:hypothetical protein